MLFIESFSAEMVSPPLTDLSILMVWLPTT